jgi:hypothetical protein
MKVCVAERQKGLCTLHQPFDIIYEMKILPEPRLSQKDKHHFSTLRSQITTFVTGRHNNLNSERTAR